MSALSPERVPVGGPTSNRLLAQLPAVEFARVRPHLKTVTLAPRQVLHKQAEPLRYVYFPNGGVVSMATLLPDGGMIEAATIGNDGLVGVEAFFTDAAVSACETLVQVPVPDDTAARLAVQDFRSLIAVCPALRRAVGRYVEVLYAVMSRLMACNAHHAVTDRCARWLLTIDDLLNGQGFHVSHEFLAAMLGVRRQTVSVVAGTLRNAGFIRYVHGYITVVDRKGLEAAACDCYPAIRGLYERLKY